MWRQRSMSRQRRQYQRRQRQRNVEQQREAMAAPVTKIPLSIVSAVDYFDDLERSVDDILELERSVDDILSLGEYQVEEGDQEEDDDNDGYCDRFSPHHQTKMNEHVNNEESIDASLFHHNNSLNKIPPPSATHSYRPLRTTLASRRGTANNGEDQDNDEDEDEDESLRHAVDEDESRSSTTGASSSTQSSKSAPKRFYLTVDSLLDDLLDLREFICA